MIFKNALKAALLLITANLWSIGAPVVNFANQNFAQIEGSGRVNIYNASVSGFTNVDGNIRIEHSTLAELTSSGPIKIENSTINGLATITGILLAKNSNFNDTLTIMAPYSYLENCVAENVIVRRSFPLKQQTLYILKNSQINGLITFDGVKGVVVVDKRSAIHGEVMNGVIVEKEGSKY